MPAYFRSSVQQFLDAKDEAIIASLTAAHAGDGYLSQYTAATKAWLTTVAAFRRELLLLTSLARATATWQVLLEYPLYRLRRRMDVVILAPSAVLVVELKTRADAFQAVDRRQVVEYAQDLRDFHAGSRQASLYPILWALEAVDLKPAGPVSPSSHGVMPLAVAGRDGLAQTMRLLAGALGFETAAQSEACGRAWDTAAYEPIPSVIDAAVTLFAGHSVREITVAGAKNLAQAADAVFLAIEAARRDSMHAVVFLTGVPGAGKTLAGLNIVHGAVERGLSTKGDIVYLSGNTPLVAVLREALALDMHARDAGNPSTLRDARLTTRATIQHINDFLKEYVHAGSGAPSGHVIVFDEAQRAWDARQGKEKFGRAASEPELVLETMARHEDWSVTVCLAGLGQEINDGEEGLSGWAEALEKLAGKTAVARWVVHGPGSVFENTRGAESIGDLGAEIVQSQDSSLHLEVPVRAFRSPRLVKWIEAVLSGDSKGAKLVAQDLVYPLKLTRKLDEARRWLRQATQGERRKGLLASSGARRLRADGLGETLNATDGASIAHWYLKPPGDIRSSHALEVPANEYTSQGLELDFACICWGGDLVMRGGAWAARRLGGNRWSNVANPQGARFILNSYRVLLSRAREGLVIWVPRGDASDATRDPAELDAVARMLEDCGCTVLDR